MHLKVCHWHVIALLFVTIIWSNALAVADNAEQQKQTETQPNAVVPPADEQEHAETTTTNTDDVADIQPTKVAQEDVGTTFLDQYRRLFKLKRADQLSAVKTILKLNDPKKQEKMIESLTKAMEKVLVSGKSAIEASGFTPGDAFPFAQSDLKETISQVLENTAFLAEMALRLPRPLSKRLSAQPAFEAAVRWAVGFSNSTGFYDDTSTMLVHLAAQQLRLVDRQPDFVNPYAAEQRLSDQRQSAELNEQVKASAEKQKKKAKQAKKKGPKLSAGTAGRSEL